MAPAGPDYSEPHEGEDLVDGRVGVLEEEVVLVRVELDELGVGELLCHVLPGSHRNEAVAPTVQDERRRPDHVELFGDVNLEQRGEQGPQDVRAHGETLDATELLPPRAVLAPWSHDAIEVALSDPPALHDSGNDEVDV